MRSGIHSCWGTSINIKLPVVVSTWVKLWQYWDRLRSKWFDLIHSQISNRKTQPRPTSQFYKTLIQGLEGQHFHQKLYWWQSKEHCSLNEDWSQWLVYLISTGYGSLVWPTQVRHLFASEKVVQQKSIKSGLARRYGQLLSSVVLTLEFGDLPAIVNGTHSHRHHRW